MSRENNETRSRILQATVDSLMESGGEGVRMSDIAKAAGVSRQAVYLHFASRTELLVAATRFLDDDLGLEERLEYVRQAKTPKDRLTRYVHFWGDYIPSIYGVANALIVARNTDEAAAAAWDDRMSALRSGCDAVIRSIAEDGQLAPGWTVDTGIEALWSMMLVPVWENLTINCGWTSGQYKEQLTLMAHTTFLR